MPSNPYDGQTLPEALEPAGILSDTPIEPTIGHMKSDGKLDRNWLKGRIGDGIHATLCGAGGLNEKHRMAA